MMGHANAARALRRGTMANKQKKATKSAGKAPARQPVTKRAAAPEAPPERMGVIELAGRPATVVGGDVRVGQAAPHFTAQVGSWAGMNTWDEIDPLEATRGKVRILTALPSLDTSVCDTETRRFNEAAVGLGDDVCVIAVSTDLPIAQKRWCAAAGVGRVMTVSDHMAGEFGVKYGTLIKERRWFRRAVFVVGKDDRLHYVAYMPRL